MARKALRYALTAGVAFRKVVVWLSADESDLSTSPTITSGSGAPSASEANGSIYLRTDGTDADDTLYVRAGGSWIAHKGQTA